MRAIEALGPFTAKAVLIAEGDSWFDYPLNDVLSKLEDEHGFDVESVAHRGDRVEDMAFTPGQLDGFSRRLEKLLQKGSIPKAILLSGGGNDIAGDEFEMLLNHAASPIAGLNDDVVTGVIDQRIRVSYAFIISTITGICEHYLHRSLPILVHGYAHPVPDGRGFLGGFSILPGPWLKPGFEKKGFGDLAKNTATMRTLIDRFNDMLRQVAGQFDNVHYVDLRATLPNDSTFKTYWANELHPTKKGFGLVATQFANVIDQLPA
ncbi:MAG: SGNH/GDSL hydrolase family protein [Gemmatimonadaceae bacterium]